MQYINKTKVTEFILLGFTEKKVEILLFSAFLLMYMTYLFGNTMITLLVCGDYCLHSPMYLFVANLSFLEVVITSTVVPKMLANTFSLTKIISFMGCLAQSIFYFLLGSTEFFILAIMPFDWCIAICNPLRYSIIVNTQACIMLLVGSYLGIFLSVLVISILTVPLVFCGPNKIHHVYCDPPMLQLACADISMADVADFISSFVLLLGSLLQTGVPKTYTVITLHRVTTVQMQQKAFSTCVSHSAVVILYYGGCILLYVHPKKGNAMSINKFVTVLQLLTPMLNLFIYSLQNEKVKESLRGASSKYINTYILNQSLFFPICCSFNYSKDNFLYNPLILNLITLLD
uniref:G-protein coupled receptors family 1 profile domain-containing protein n=1 Tax=Mustela putorius furo TaxID=9669 RepID=M3XQY9_MUSPF